MRDERWNLQIATQNASPDPSARQDHLQGLVDVGEARVHRCKLTLHRRDPHIELALVPCHLADSCADYP